MNHFEQMNLPTKLYDVLKSLNYHEPTPIQAQAIPLAIAGKDLIGCAQTGTGKTAAFCIPIILELLKSSTSTSLILVPTRELAFQITDLLKKLTSNFPHLRHALIIGGASMHQQLRDLSRKPRIFVATPGRLIDHLNGRSVSLKNLSILVLDEADRMLDMGFAPQLNKILTYLQGKRQTLLFSATLPEDVEKMAQRYLHQPENITVGPKSQPVEQINQTVIQTTQEGKKSILEKEVKSRAGSILIFTRTKHRADRVCSFLRNSGNSVDKIHGGRTQGQRNRTMMKFRSGESRVLVATDIAARGLDIRHIRHVINFDLPRFAEDYVHRIGRTARAGDSGEALNLLTSEDRHVWREISKRYNVSGNLSSDFFNSPLGQKNGSGRRRRRRRS